LGTESLYTGPVRPGVTFQGDSRGKSWANELTAVLYPYQGLTQKISKGRAEVGSGVEGMSKTKK